MTSGAGSTRYQTEPFAQLSGTIPQVGPAVAGSLPVGGGLPPGGGLPWGTLTVIGLVAAALYVAACSWWPFTACRHRCEGGRVRSPSGRAWRRCWWCKGRGSRVRWGRRVFDAVRGRGWRADV